MSELTGLDPATAATPRDPRIAALLNTGMADRQGGGNSAGNVIDFPQRASGGGSVKDAVAQEWLSAGYSPAAVQGIMRRVQAESGFDPFAIGDGGTSLSLYQHHADRAQKLAQFLQQNKADTSDPVQVARLSTKFAISEMNGGDPIASKARDSLMKATDPNQAYGLFTSSFERPAGAPGSEETNLRSTATGPFNEQAKGLLSRWQSDLEQRGKTYDAAIAQSSELHSASRAALQKWMSDSDKPPQNMREAWSQWSGPAIALAALGGLFGRHQTASLNAAGEMLQAANAADTKTYDKQYQQWKDHLDRGLKLVELLHTEAQDIVGDAGKPYDRKVSELQTLSVAYQLDRQLDPNSVENLSKNLQLAKSRRELIQEQNAETEVRNSVRELDEAWEKEHPGQQVPALVHSEHQGQVKQATAGKVTAAGALTDDAAQFMAKQYLAGDRSVMGGLGYGNVGAANRAKLRDSIQAEARARGMSPEQVATTIAEFEGLKAGERTLGTTAARIGLGFAEAKVFAPMVVEASDKVNRTQYPKLNELLLAYDRGTGDENVVRLAISVNALTNAYSQVLTRGGVPTDAARATAHEVFDKAYSSGQMRTAVDQVMREINAAQQAPGIVREEMRNQGAGAGAAPASGAATGGNVIRYDAQGNRQ
jgi:hypothetical protein